MEQSELLRRLRQLLATTFHDPAQAKLLALDAGLSLADIDFTGSPNVIWGGILDEARREGRGKALMDRAIERAPAIQELEALQVELLNQFAEETASSGKATSDGDPSMVQLAREVSRGITRPEYHAFLRNHLLPCARRNRITSLPDDPFAPELAEEVDPAVWVLRDSAKAMIVSKPNVLFVMGPRGTGKTSLLRQFGFLCKSDELAVSVDLADHGSREPSESFANWLFGKLQYCAFKTYFDLLLAKDSRRPKHPRADIAQYRLDRQWLELLGRLFHRLKPQPLVNINDYQLQAWLAAQAPSGMILPGPRYQFEELARVITWRLPSASFDPSASGFKRVHFFVDGTENFNEVELRSTAHSILDVEGWLPPDSVSVTILCDARLTQVVDQVRVGSTSHVGRADLPPWTETELKELLLRRLCGIEQPWDFNWGVEWLHASGALSGNASAAIIDRLVIESRLLEQEGSSLGAPLHLLRLMQGVLTLCGGHAKNQHVVTNREITLFIQAYRRAIESVH